MWHLGTGAGKFMVASSGTSTESLLRQDNILHEEYIGRGGMRKVGKHLIPEDVSSLAVVCWVYSRRCGADGHS